MLIGQSLRGLGYQPGDACYDPTKWSWLPNTSTPDDFYEMGCYMSAQFGWNTGSPATTTMTYTPPAPSADTGTLAPGDVNDPNNTNVAVTAGNPTEAQLAAQAAQNARDSVTGLTPGGCLTGQTGTYPNCKDATPSTTGFYVLLAVAIGGILLVAVKGK